MKLTRAETIAKNRIDRQINDVVRRRCAGRPINVLDISKVFAAGHEAARNSADIEMAVVTTYQRLSAEARHV